MMNITELTCRVCLEEQDIMINIYDELDDLQSNLSNLLETCGDLQIDENDIFPKYLCEECTRELLITSKFREKCCKSKEILNEILQQYEEAELKESENLNEIEYSTEDLNNIIAISDVLIEETHIMNDTDEHQTSEDVSNDVPEDTITLQTNEIEVPLESGVSYDLKTNEAFKEDKVVNIDSTITLVDSWKPLETEDNIEPPDVQASGDTIRNPSFQCDICGATFKQAINLQKHLQKAHAPLKCFSCEKCDHWFSLETEFFKHMQCCNYFQTPKDEVQDNKKKKSDKITAQNQDEDNRKCVYCEREFPTPFALRMHLRTHTGERPFQCKYCAKSFKTQSALNVHSKRHTGQADYICTVCNKTFYEQGNLSVHMRSHTGERPHVCTVCQKTFTRVYLLQLHMRTHTGEKPYNCNYCDKSFRQSTDLRSHVTIHTGYKQYSCPLCSKAYIKRSHLVQHMSKHSVLGAEVENGEAIQCEQTIQEVSDGSINISIQDPEVLYSFDDIIESEDVVLQSDNIS